MFKKYITKISNTIGTVNYLQQKTKENHQQHRHRKYSRSHKHLFDDGYDVDVDYDSTNQFDIDLSANGSRKGSVFVDDFVPNEQIILSEAIAHLRNTLLFYPLVFRPFCFVFLKFSLF